MEAAATLTASTGLSATAQDTIVVGSGPTAGVPALNEYPDGALYPAGPDLYPSVHEYPSTTYYPGEPGIVLSASCGLVAALTGHTIPVSAGMTVTIAWSARATSTQLPSAAFAATTGLSAVLGAAVIPVFVGPGDLYPNNTLYPADNLYPTNFDGALYPWDFLYPSDILYPTNGFPHPNAAASLSATTSITCVPSATLSAGTTITAGAGDETFAAVAWIATTTLSGTATIRFWEVIADPHVVVLPTITASAAAPVPGMRAVNPQPVMR